ncbi:MAG: DUF1501 domain-containing protein [Acidobacteria bacterium]|nr:DUF1501 domain-containing protein [Acidobacteriota bacterium]
MLRRKFIQLTGVGALTVAQLKARTQVLPSSKTVQPRKSAKNVILVFLAGGQSHVDTFDLKVGNWTPSDFEPGTFGNLYMPAGLFPNLVQHTDKFSILRAMEGKEAVHQRASYQLQTCHTFNPVFSQEQPHLGSLLAYELESERAATDILPGFVAINNTSSIQGPGMLASTYAALRFNGQEGLPGLVHPDGESLFNQRWNSLMKLDGNDRLNPSALGSQVSDYHHFYISGEQMMYEADVTEAFNLTENDLARYGSGDVGSGCALAVKILAKNRGTRVVQVTQGGWDQHYDIYDKNVNSNLYDTTSQLDIALAAMLEDLASLPGAWGGTLLDETLVVVTGEFGRTPGPLSTNDGRNHYQYAWSALMAGGGVVPNQAFGATDPEGWFIQDPFWNRGRNIHINDLIATIYSSMGVDWSKEILDTPSGRVFEYTPKVNGVAGYYDDVFEMFG